MAQGSSVHQAWQQSTKPFHQHSLIYDFQDEESVIGRKRKGRDPEENVKVLRILCSLMWHKLSKLPRFLPFFHIHSII